MSVKRLDLDILNSLLKTRMVGRAGGWVNELWDTLDSTNSRAAELARAGALEGVMILARKQTGGRGRGGRTWVSPRDAGLYVSFILRPQLEPGELPLMSLAAGLAAASAIELTAGAKIKLKWVNDLVAGGKKVGGILAEMPAGFRPKTGQRGSGNEGQGNNRTEAAPALILGIGINLRLDPETLPDDLADRVDWLERIAGQEIDDNLLAANLAAQIERVYEDLVSGQRHKIVAEWKEASVNLGRAVRATTGNTSVEGTACDITSEGALIIALPGGERLTVHAGDVMLRNADGSYA